MVTKIGNTEEVLVGEFKRVKNGLDEGEVLSAIKGLIERNRSLTDRFAHIDSLTKLAEGIVIEAEREAQIIKKEAISKGSSIIEGAQEKAKSEADSLMAETEQWADKAARAIMASAQRQAEEIKRATETQAQQQAEEMMKAAKTKAESEAEEIVKAAETKAQRQAGEIMTRVEAEAERHAEEIIEVAETIAEQKAQESLLRIRDMFKRVIVEEFGNFIESLISDAEEIETYSS